MTPNNRTEPGVCTRCGDTRVIPIGDGHSVNPCPDCTGQQPGVCPECAAVLQRVLDKVADMTELAGPQWAKVSNFIHAELQGRGTGQQPAQPRRCCRKHEAEDLNGRIFGRLFIVCPTCQDKRCAHAEDCANACTSQQPAQPGSGEARRFEFVGRHMVEVAPGTTCGGTPFVMAADYDRLQSALTAAQQPAQPAQPGSGEVVPPSRRVTANAYVQGIRHGVDPVTLVREMLDYQLYLQSSLTAAQQRIAELESDLENERARGIHTCHDQCQRPLCVAQRRIRELEALNAERNRQNAAAFEERDELQRQIERYAWLVKHGESYFGSLWREATGADIDVGMAAGREPS